MDLQLLYLWAGVVDHQRKKIDAIKAGNKLNPFVVWTVIQNNGLGSAVFEARQSLPHSSESKVSTFNCYSLFA